MCIYLTKLYYEYEYGILISGAVFPLWDEFNGNYLKIDFKLPVSWMNVMNNGTNLV